MSAPLSEWGAALVGMLADGAWHPVDEVLDVMAAKVPPGRAYRRGETMRAQKVGARGGDPQAPRQRGDKAIATAAGARSIARGALRSRLRDGRLEHRQTPAGPAVRLVRGSAPDA